MHSSETLVTASIIPPASFINLTTCASSWGTMSFRLTRPAVFLSPGKKLELKTEIIKKEICEENENL
jgi:hypothetical protein